MKPASPPSSTTSGLPHAKDLAEQLVTARKASKQAALF